jgi:hypothetical protein
MKKDAFIFDRYSFKPETGTLHLHYSFEDGPFFEEKIVFANATRELNENDKYALDNAFRLLFLLAGVSYYKAYVPAKLVCRAFPLDKTTAAFVEKVYRNGLGEFAFRNKIDLAPLVNFVSNDASAPQAVKLGLPHHLLIPVGGGKDSIVTIETLKPVEKNITLFALGGASGMAEPIKASIGMAQLPHLYVARTLSPNLIELNKQGALNGHVPITAILSAITVCCAILYGFDTVVLSNEHSASAPNLRIGDLEINHQYSKSFSFETDLSDYIAAHISPDINYFSLLRPLSEAAILKRFAGYKNYHPIFRSCNTAFKQDAAARNKNWCCDCPKCRFVFLGLAPFITKDELLAIFGKNMLNDPTQKEGFAELCGVAAYKPFECVGEIEESALLMAKLSQSPEWRDDFTVRELGQKLYDEAHDFDAEYAELFDLRAGHRVPAEYTRLLDGAA